MKRDILFLCQFFYPEQNSSATLPFDTARYLAGRGFSVDAMCGYPKEYNFEGKTPLKEKVAGVDIRRLHYIQLRRTGKLGRLVNYFSFTLSALLHLPTLGGYKCVMVYSNPPVLPLIPILANRLFGTKLVFVAYDVYPEVAYASGALRPGSLIDRVMKSLNRRLYSRAAMVVALTDEMRSFLLENRPQLSPERVTAIANWAHEGKVLVCPQAYERFGYRPEQFIVAYFGNMGICQEMETLLGAMRELKGREDIQFLFVGHGSKKERVRQFVAEESISNAKVYDFLTGEDFEYAVAVASCCVVSLEKGLKGTCAPSKYYSYLQGGKPVIAIVEEGSYLAEEVEGERIGCAVSLGDSSGLAADICSLAGCPESAAEMGLRAEKLYLSKYAYEKAMEKYLGFFQEFLID